MLTLKKAKKAGKYVDTKHVDSLLSTYKKERWIHNSKRIGKEDSLSVWYSVEELQEFLATAKQNGAVLTLKKQQKTRAMKTGKQLLW
jgi:hypothetical protein